MTLSAPAPVGNGVDLLTVGEAMTAVRCHGMLRLGSGATISVAGAESNVAVGVAQLGHRVAFGGRVGEDESGALVLRSLTAEGVDTSAVVRDADAATGLLIFERRLPDLTRVEYHRAGSAGSRWGLDDGDIAAALATRPRVLHVSGITAALSDSAREGLRALVLRARETGVLVSLDVNVRARLWSREQAAPVLRDLARLADLVIASPEELALVAEDAHELLAAGVREVVVKDGAAGAVAVTADGEAREPARTVPVVSTVGAGDAFGAGYLSGLLDDAPVAERLRRGVVLGAFAVAHEGDWEGLPTRAELPLLDRTDDVVR